MTNGKIIGITLGVIIVCGIIWITVSKNKDIKTIKASMRQIS